MTQHADWEDQNNMSKYNASGSQSDHEPGSNNQVLKNKLGITSSEDMDDVELTLLEKLYEWVLIDNLPVGQITVKHLKDWHKNWLGNVYDWAGDERSVNMSKGDFHFAVATQIPKLLSKFEQDYLKKFTPCSDFDEEALIEAIAVTHVEFILVHPFRDGNGRLSRLLADVMAVQAGYEPLDYSAWDAKKADYILAIQHGLNCNYEPMKYWVRQALL